MRWFEKAVVAACLATMGLLLFKLDPGRVWTNLAQVGWGLVLIVPLHGIDQVLNAYGWRFAFSAGGDQAPLGRLLEVRVAGDGVNYLTPSATIAGEIIRPGMLGDFGTSEARIASVVIAKFTQALSQALFVLFGILFIAWARIPFAERAREWAHWAAGALAALLLAMLVYGLATRNRPRAARGASGGGPWSLSSLRGEIGGYLRLNPGRFIMSTALFLAGYLSGAIEAYVICAFLGLPITVSLALAIEILSTFVDGVTFMVPAKVGTQEAGKTAIFAGLGLPASAGFAFGVIRHVRELAWAAAGFLLYARHQRRVAAGADEVRAPLNPGPVSIRR